MERNGGDENDAEDTGKNMKLTTAAKSEQSVENIIELLPNQHIGGHIGAAARNATSRTTMKHVGRTAI